MKKVTREQFGKACLEYDLKSGTLIEIDGRIGFNEGGEIDEECSTYSTAEEWIDWYAGDYYDMHGAEIMTAKEREEPECEGLTESIANVYAQIMNGLRDDVDITGKGVWGINAI
jgi:hypothetical protein